MSCLITLGRGVAALSPQRQRSDIFMSSSNWREIYIPRAADHVREGDAVILNKDVERWYERDAEELSLGVFCRDKKP